MEIPPYLIDGNVYSLPNDKTLENFLDASNHLENLCVLVLSDLQDKVPEIAFLSKIMSAVGLDLTSQVALLEVEKEKVQDVRFAKLTAGGNFKKIIAFGATTFDFGLRMKLTNYEVLAFSNMQLLTADSLSLIEKDSVLKKQLWNSLQKLYSSK